MVEFGLVGLLVAAVVAFGLAVWRRAGGRPGSRGVMALRAGALALVALPAVLAPLWSVSKSRTFQLFGETVARVKTDEKVVALTFDDGPAPFGTERVLAELEREGVRATFFVNGSALADYPELGRRLARAGHELGNHTYTHRQMLGRSWEFIRRELEETDRRIRETGYQGEIHFRAPYGKRLFLLPLYLWRTGRKHVCWDIEPETYPEVGASAERISEHVLSRVRPGSIILLHVMFPAREQSLEAVPAIIRGLKERGYRCVTVSELLRRRR